VDHLCRNWVLVENAKEARNVNGILGLLCKKHFPGLVEKGDNQWEPAWTFDHYALVEDVTDPNGIRCRNKADRVITELRVSLCCTTFIGHSLNKIMDSSCLYAGLLQDPGGTGGKGVSGGLRLV
jgi:hypothetical protein